LHFKEKIYFSTSLAGQAVGIKEVEDDIWLVSFMDYDLGYIDLEEKTLRPLNNPFGPKVYIFGTFCNGSLRTVQCTNKGLTERGIRTPVPVLASTTVQQTYVASPSLRVLCSPLNSFCRQFLHNPLHKGEPTQTNQDDLTRVTLSD